jgi:hypothetical protein
MDEKVFLVCSTAIITFTITMIIAAVIFGGFGL